jgi:hypothetical protein
LVHWRLGLGGKCFPCTVEADDEVSVWLW